MYTNSNMDEPTQSINTLLKTALQERAVTVSKLSGGYNSDVYKVGTDKKNQYVAKRYIVRESDARDRLTTEFQGLSFLWRNGIRNIPQPLCMSKSDQLGIYRYIPGKKMQQQEITLPDVEIAAEFLRSMHQVAHEEKSHNQPVASEACFSLHDYSWGIEQRINTLLHTDSFSRHWKTAVHHFLTSEFQPVFYQIRQFVADACTDRGMDAHAVLPPKARTLSSTDFSFHNAIRYKRTVYFIDFEYYGWDDPSKVVANFFLHPGVVLPAALRVAFYEHASRIFASDDGFGRRLPFIYLLMSLKWSLIMLNVFTRSVSGPNDTIKRNYGIQLEKARKQLRKTIREHKQRTFPLSLL